MMNARDSSGRCVSLLNEEPDVTTYYSPHHASTQSNSSRSHSSSPITPGFTRADSYDSYNSSPSPTTTTSFHDFSHQMSYTTGINTLNQMHPQYSEKRNHDRRYPSPSNNSRPNPTTYEVRSSYGEPHVYDEESYPRSSVSERTPKRYPCRYRDSHHCLKTFTTSGHASRHSKIHTAEKGVSCTWEGCHKKFTRSDNMKQHLETHTKERSRTTKPSSTAATHRIPLVAPAGIKKSSINMLSGNRSVARHTNCQNKTQSRLHSRACSPEMSPLSGTTIYRQLHAMATAGPTPSSQTVPTFSPNGLDALAFAAAVGTHR